MAHHFPNDEVTMENVAMEAFDAEQTAASATGQDVANEEQVVLEVACGATRLREELRAELQREAPLASFKINLHGEAGRQDGSVQDDSSAESCARGGSPSQHRGSEGGDGGGKTTPQRPGAEGGGGDGGHGGGATMS
jgi:hypothetical protein